MFDGVALYPLERPYGLRNPDAPIRPDELRFRIDGSLNGALDVGLESLAGTGGRDEATEMTEEERFGLPGSRERLVTRLLLMLCPESERTRLPLP